jgi:hypothetical protein
VCHSLVYSPERNAANLSTRHAFDGLSSVIRTFFVLRSHEKTNSAALIRVPTIPTERPTASCRLVLSFADRGVSRSQHADPLRPNLAFLDLSLYFFFQVTPQLYSRD